MHPLRHRPFAALLVVAALGASGAVIAASPAQAADTDIKINEINHVGTDFVELVNTGSAPVTVSGFKLLDGDTTHAQYSIPAGVTIAPGGYYAVDTLPWGLGDGDSATLFAGDGTTVLDTFTWTAPGAPSSSWGRCPDKTGPFTVTAAATKGTPNSCTANGPVKINEIESLGGTPGDWVELVNTAATTTDLSGMQLKDSSAATYTFPGGSMVPAGGYLVVEQAQLGFALDDADSIRLSAADGLTVFDSYTWTAPAATTTYGRCPDATGAITKTRAVTKGVANSCIVAGAWPGGSAVSTVDSQGFFGENMSGLAYEGTGTTTPGTLWAVKNNPGTLYKLSRSGAGWATAAGDWTAGKTLRFGNGQGNVDAEGVTMTSAGSAGGVYVAVERDNSVSGTSRPSVLRFDPNAAGTTLTATTDWNLTADLPGLGANLGPEAITWVPDSFLVSKGFKRTDGTAYDPAAYAGHGTGLFFVGIEQTGLVYAYALSEAGGGTATRVAEFDSGFTAVMELHFEQQTSKLWVVCDDTCQGRSALFDVDTTAGPTQGRFVAGTYQERPGGMANLNNEGFTTTPASECVGGTKPVFWADDSATGGFALRAGTLACATPSVPTAPTITAAVTSTKAKTASGWYGAPVTVSFTCTPGSAALTTSCPAPVVLSTSGSGQAVTRTVTDAAGLSATASAVGLNVDLVAPIVAIKGVKAGKAYSKKKKPTCVGSDSLSGLASCTISQEKKGKKYVVTATATDQAGNVSTTTLKYEVRKKR